MGKAESMKIIAIQGDKLEALNLKGDSSLYIASMMQHRNYQIFWYEPKNLYYADGNIAAIGKYISVEFDGNNLQYTIFSSDIELNLATVNCIMIRQDPPVDMHYITSSHLLSILSFINPKIFFINHPDVIIQYGEKFLPLIVCPERVPNTVITSNFNQINEFIKQHGKSVIKPIYGYGGHDVMLVEKHEVETMNSQLNKSGSIQLIVQEFLPEIYNGDKRVVVYDGQILGALGRVPEDGNFLTNTCAGGVIQAIELSDNESLICLEIAAKLDKLGIFLSGIDMIGQYITEINITSPGLIISLHKLYGKEIMEDFFTLIDKKSTH